MKSLPPAAQTRTFVHTAVFKDSEPPPLALQDGAGSLELNVMRTVGPNKGEGVGFWCTEDEAREQEEQSSAQRDKSVWKRCAKQKQEAEQIKDGAN